MRPPATLDQLQRHLGEIRTRIDCALTLAPTAWQQLQDNQPGYPTGKDGNGAADTQPERLATVLDRDSAYRDLIQLQIAAAHAFDAVQTIYDVAGRWGRRPEASTFRGEVPDPSEWCASCLRIGKCSPRFRGDECSWCYDYRRSEGEKPPVDLLTAHHEGRKITRRMVREVGPRRRRKGVGR